MATIARLSTLAVCALLSACASVPPAPAVSFVIVRHAEKSQDDPRDPSLSEAGRARAQGLAEALSAEPVQAVYATGYRRTRQTGEPTARAHRLSVTVYDASQPATDFAETLRRAHPGGTVLVVGHSNTAPEIAAALCGCAVAPMSETEFDRRMRVEIGRDGRATYRASRDR